MVFQAKKWNWKRVAANLLLVPVLTGGTVAIVHAQFGRGTAVGPLTPNATAPATRPPASPNDPKQLVKDGRRALDEGKFADARDLAAAADANNPAGKWGLFDDTPNALRKDIDSAQTKANKAQAEQFMNYVYDPAHQAQIAAYVQYFSPVDGAKEAMLEIDASLAENTLIFPDDATLARANIFRALDEAEERELNEAFQTLIGA